MGRPDSSSAWWRWLLFVALSLRASAEPHFLLVLPAVVESGSSVHFCLTLLQVSHEMTVTIGLYYNGERRVFYRDSHDEESHISGTFQAPAVERSEIYDIDIQIEGKKFHKVEKKKILVKNYGLKTFVQTDKPLYLPGQTVHFRVVTLDSQLRPADGSYELIEVKDASQNRVAQWLERSSDGRILQLSYDLDPHAREGTYSVKVRGHSTDVTHSFQVQKYVLPKFSVELETPAEVSVALEELSFKACAKYTFGQSVPGSVEVDVCRSPLFRFAVGSDRTFEVCHKAQQQVSKDGCASFSVPTAQFYNNSRLENEYVIKATMSEEGTGSEQQTVKRVQLSYQIGKVEFVNPPKGFNPGDVFELQVKAVHHNDTPVSHTDLYLFSNLDLILQTMKSDQDGVATFKFNTSGSQDSVTLKASLYVTDMNTYQNPHFAIAFLTLTKINRPSLHTKTTSTLEVQAEDQPLVCGEKQTFTISYTFVGESQGTAAIVFLVMSRGVIVKSGLYSTYMDTIMEGTLSFPFEISPDMAPTVTVVSYAVLPSESVLAASRDFETERCFSNKVALQFAPPSSVPGELSSLKVSAAPQSLCGLTAVDKSVLLQSPGTGLHPEKIFSLLPVKMAESFPDQIEDELGCVKVRSRRSLYLPTRNTEKDVYNILKNRGLKMATNLFIRTPSCVNFRGTEFHQRSRYHYYGYGRERGGVGGMALEIMPQVLARNYPLQYSPLLPPPPPLTPIQTERTFFPETWLWDLVEVGESGHTELPLTVPDTITTWYTEAFCLSPQQGIGLSFPQQLTVFQPFFLQLTLPYSIIRGESFELKATVFNYLSSCIMMEIHPIPSPDFTLTPLSGDQYTSCLCGNERKTLSWTLLASTLGEVNVTVKAEAIPSAVQCDNEVLSVPERGRVDIVTKPLRVQAEGTQVSQTHNWLLCPRGGLLKEEVELTLPENVIQGSSRASVSVLGDILGRAMKNLDGLLKMPYGCGEQNMALLAPNIYILQYLKNTQQLSPEVKERALKFLSSGYQRQLNYNHGDGSYSAFGRGEGNTWLTAFVVRCFAKAKAFVYVDPEKIFLSRKWLKNRQKEDGCFRPSGKLFNNRMKGGVSDDVTLSAYITAAFLEMNMSRTDAVVERSLSCLKNHSQNMDNVYTTALMAYVFSLARDTETRAQLLNKLRSQATDEGAQTHWSSPSSDSLSVEISSYVLLSILTQDTVSLEDMGYASKIVRWLTGQQNPYGGFRSTQDTVVALQALSLYSTLVFFPEGSSTVLVQDLNRPTEGSLSFTVDLSNRLLYQERSLEGATGKYSLEVTGSACASVQISVHYNIPTPSEVKTLGVKANTTMHSEKPLLLMLQAEYFGDQNSTNMVILDVKMLSGFVPDERSLKALESMSRVDRVEQNGDHVLIYISELPKNKTLLYLLSLRQETVVQNLKPAVVKIYDYYQPSDEAETEYSVPAIPAEQN